MWPSSLRRREPDSIGVLVRDKQQMSRVVHGLGERGVAARQVDSVELLEMRAMRCDAG